jgi:hypothetical protein
MAGTMEDQLLQLLADTQNASQGPRKQAEEHLQQLQTNEAYPISLSAIASHQSVATAIRQSALSVLRRFVEKNWSGQNDDDSEGQMILIPDSSKEKLRSQLLELATSIEEDRKVKSAARYENSNSLGIRSKDSFLRQEEPNVQYNEYLLMTLNSYVVSKIASVDFPDEWPTLLPTLLHMIPTAPDSQLHGALKVLADLVDDALSEDQFFSVARDIVKVVYDVAINPARKANLRALSVSIFRGCFDIMDMVKDEQGSGPEVKAFADEVLNGWSPFFLEVLKEALPQKAPLTDQSETTEQDGWRGLVALKLQVVKTLMKIRSVFPQLLLPQSPTLFAATWAELSLHQAAFQDMYVDHDEQGKLEDADNLPYTLDFLVLEELDFLQSCLRAPPVQKELEAQLQASGGVQDTPWVLDVMKLAVGYAQIPSEEEGLWDIDVNLFLAEETSITANYTARTACGDLLIKLGEWLHQGALEGLLAYTKTLFAAQESTWRTKEASLFLLTRLMIDFIDVDKSVPVEISSAYLEFIDYALNRPEEELLRARGYLVADVIVQTTNSESFPTLALLDRTIKAINDDESEVVKVACIKAIQGFTKAPGGIPTDRQVPIAVAISDFLHAKDLTELEDADDLLVTLVESLRAAILLDTRVSIHPGSGVLDLLFLIAKHGAASFQLTMLVNETFEEIVSSLSSMGPEAYTALCEKVLPSLTGAFDVGTMTEDNPLTTASFPALYVFKNPLMPLLARCRTSCCSY